MMKKLLRPFIYLCLFTVLILCFVYLGKRDYAISINDSEKFANEYSGIPKDNPFVYVKAYEVLDILKNKTGIILIGFASNPWMQSYVNNLYDVLKVNNIKKVYYYDVLEDRIRKSKNFREIEDLLADYLKVSDYGNEHLFTPSLVFVKNGKVVNYDDETALYSYNMTPDKYWNEKTISDFKNKINIYLGEDNYNEE